jgi:ketosteroid isomerase-like protein
VIFLLIAPMPADTKADTQKNADEWMSAYNKKDAATIAKMYGDNAVFSGPGWTASSRAAIEDALTKEIASGAFSRLTAITVDQSHRVGDMNYASGSWSADMKGPDGKDMPVGGHWLIVSEYKNGIYTALVHNANWRCHPRSEGAYHKRLGKANLGRFPYLRCKRAISL